MIKFYILEDNLKLNKRLYFCDKHPDGRWTVSTSMFFDKLLANSKIDNEFYYEVTIPAYSYLAEAEDHTHSTHIEVISGPYKISNMMHWEDGFECIRYLETSRKNMKYVKASSNYFKNYCIENCLIGVLPNRPIYINWKIEYLRENPHNIHNLYHQSTRIHEFIIEEQPENIKYIRNPSDEIKRKIKKMEPKTDMFATVRKLLCFT